MSHDHINAARAARRLFDLSPPAGHVALVLATHCNDAGECWPSIPTLTDETGYHRDTVERAVVELEAAGLEVTRRPGRVTLYRIPAAWSAARAATAEISTTPRPGRGVQKVLTAGNPAASPRTPRGVAAGYPAARPRVTDQRTVHRTDASAHGSRAILSVCPARRSWKICDETCETCHGSGHVDAVAERPRTASSYRRFRTPRRQAVMNE